MGGRYVGLSTKLVVCGAATLATVLTFGPAHCSRPVLVGLGERVNASFQAGGLPFEIGLPLEIGLPGEGLL